MEASSKGNTRQPWNRIPQQLRGVPSPETHQQVAWLRVAFFFFFPFSQAFLYFVLIVLILDFLKKQLNITNTVEVSCIRVPIMMLFANAESNNNNLTLFEHLLCARRCSEYCMCISLISHQPDDEEGITIPSLWTGEVKHIGPQ